MESATDKGKDVSESIGEVEGTVFDEAVALLQRLEKELINEISDSVALDVKAKSRAYRTDKYELLQTVQNYYQYDFLDILLSILFKMVRNATFQGSGFTVHNTKWLSHVSRVSYASSHITQCTCSTIISASLEKLDCSI